MRRGISNGRVSSHGRLGEARSMGVRVTQNARNLVRRRVNSERSCSFVVQHLVGWTLCVTGSRVIIGSGCRFRLDAVLAEVSRLGRSVATRVGARVCKHLQLSSSGGGGGRGHRDWTTTLHFQRRRNWRGRRPRAVDDRFVVKGEEDGRCCLARLRDCRLLVLRVSQ